MHSIWYASVGLIFKFDNNVISLAREGSTHTAAFSPLGGSYQTIIIHVVITVIPSWRTRKSLSLLDIVIILTPCFNLMLNLLYKYSNLYNTIIRSCCLKYLIKIGFPYVIFPPVSFVIRGGGACSLRAHPLDLPLASMSQSIFQRYELGYIGHSH